MKTIFATSAFLVGILTTSLAQTTDTTTASAPTQAATAAAPNSGLTVSGYIEAYYSHDFTAPKTAQERPGFLYNHKRNREVNVNLAFIKAAYVGQRVRGNLAIQVGTYGQYNYAAEQGLVKNIFEANAGVKLSGKKDLWLDAGIFSSHIGFESAISKDCWTLTRSILAENSPYYLAGAKVTYNTSNGKWTLLGSVLNGWQRIAKLPGYTERRDDYPHPDGGTVHDDRTRCAHFGQCTDRLPEVFDGHGEPFVHPDGAPATTVAGVVSGCPSGALTWTPADAHETAETGSGPSITPIVDGPYRVRGVPVIGADGEPYEVRERQALCRCGHSRNKPFCDGSHWYAGFRDPLPPDLVPAYPTLYDWAGGIEAFQALTERFYADLLAEPDPVLEPIFRGMDPGHPKHVAAWLAETFGGPATYTLEHGGYHAMVNHHGGLSLTEEQRRRWIDRMTTTADLVGLSADPDFRAAFVGYLEWGTRIALFNSAPGVELIQHGPVPKWTWGAAPPYVPFPWDDPDAADRGRERYAASLQEGSGGPA